MTAKVVIWMTQFTRKHTVFTRLGLNSESAASLSSWAPTPAPGQQLSTRSATAAQSVSVGDI